MDSLENDIENLETINRLIGSCQTAEGHSPGHILRQVESFVISPSEDIDALSAMHVNELPATLRYFLKMTGSGRSDNDVNIASYLLFTEAFSRELIKMGYRDTLDQAAEIIAFMQR